MGFLGSLELSEIGVFWVFKVLGLIMYLRIPLGDALGSRMPWYVWKCPVGSQNLGVEECRWEWNDLPLGLDQGLMVMVTKGLMVMGMGMVMVIVMVMVMVLF